MPYFIICPCTNVPFEYSEKVFDKHFNSGKHLSWFLEKEENINKLFVQCGCGQVYNFQNAHNHFKSVDHRKWEAEAPGEDRRNNVLIPCKCGYVIPYKKRAEHNKVHVLPVFMDQV